MDGATPSRNPKRIRSAKKWNIQKDPQQHGDYNFKLDIIHQVTEKVTYSIKNELKFYHDQSNKLQTDFKHVAKSHLCPKQLAEIVFHGNPNREDFLKQDFNAELWANNKTERKYWEEFINLSFRCSLLKQELQQIEGNSTASTKMAIMRDEISSLSDKQLGWEQEMILIQGKIKELQQKVKNKTVKLE